MGELEKAAAAALLGLRGPALPSPWCLPDLPRPSGARQPWACCPDLPAAERLGQGCGLLNAGRSPPACSELSEAADVGPDARHSVRVGLGKGEPQDMGPAFQ